MIIHQVRDDVEHFLGSFLNVLHQHSCKPAILRYFYLLELRESLQNKEALIAVLPTDHFLIDVSHEWQQHEIDLIVPDIAQHKRQMLPIALLVNGGVHLIEKLFLRLIVVAYGLLPVLLEDLMKLLAAQISTVVLPLPYQG